jgi:hypothetical protein
MVRNVRRSIHRAVSLTDDLPSLPAEAVSSSSRWDMQLTSVTSEVVEDYEAKADARDWS